MASISIAARYCGPPGMGNGGYVAGLLAAGLGDCATVKLRAPTPLDRPLQLARGEGAATLRDGDTLVAEASVAELEIDVPAPPPHAVAERALQEFRGYDRHPFPHCFVCGPGRARGDGLRVFALPVPQTAARLAASWTPEAGFADEAGLVRSEFLWGALDCPGGMSIGGVDARRVVTAEITARIERRVRIGEPCVVIAWPISRAGRKHYAGSAIFSAQGERCAVARALWIELPDKDQPS
ncbi:MAG: hypothetical protein AB7O31_04085 [Burkholderiales bacterium]